MIGCYEFSLPAYQLKWTAKSKEKFKYLFLILDLFIITLLGSLFIPLIVFNFVGVCFSKTYEQVSVNLEYKLSVL